MPRPEKIIAIEEHILTTGFSLRLQEFAKFENMMRDVDGRLEEMDRCGVVMHVLSLSSPGVQRETDAKLAQDKAARSNDEIAKTVETYPTRFAAFASVALQDCSFYFRISIARMSYAR